jgi:hypothetical protein
VVQEVREFQVSRPQVQAFVLERGVARYQPGRQRSLGGEDHEQRPPLAGQRAPQPPGRHIDLVSGGPVLAWRLPDDVLERTAAGAAIIRWHGGRSWRPRPAGCVRPAVCRRDLPDARDQPGRPPVIRPPGVTRQPLRLSAHSLWPFPAVGRRGSGRRLKSWGRAVGRPRPGRRARRGRCGLGRLRRARRGGRPQ